MDIGTILQILGFSGEFLKDGKLKQVLEKTSRGGRLISTLLAPGRQMKREKELLDYKAKLNYEYGEKAAKNAFDRQMQLYERSYQDNSYAAKRAQMEGAGLSVGLMYGGAGASGGGAGSTTGAPQGATGASGGEAPNEMAAIQVLLAGKQLSLQEKKNQAEIDLLKAEAENQKAQAGNAAARTVTENLTRKIEAGIKWLTGVSMNRELLLKMLIDKKGVYDYKEAGETMDIMKFGNELGGQFGDVAFTENSATMTKIMQELYQTEAKINETIENTNKLISEQDLNTEKKKALWEELRIAAINADANQINALAHQLAAQWETGEYTNWKTWVNLGKEAAKLIIDGLTKAFGAKTATEVIETIKTGGWSKTIKTIEK